MPAFNYLELNQINYLDMVMAHLIFSFVKMFLFYKHFVFDYSQFGIIGRSFLLSNCLLSNHYLITQKLDSQFLLQKFYAKHPPDCMKCFLVSRKKRNACMFIAFTGSTSRAGICVACLKLTTLGRRIINRL